jgi:transposase
MNYVFDPMKSSMDRKAEQLIGKKFRSLSKSLDERQRRLWAGSEAKAAGHGGIAAVARATGLAHTTVRRGVEELASRKKIMSGRVRKPGGGRKSLTSLDADLVKAMEQLVEPAARGDPESPLRWTCKSTRLLAQELTAQGHPVSRTRVADLLKERGYSLQANRKTREGTRHPDRNAQFEHLNERVKKQLAAAEPAISVDTKKKELVGDFKNAGREWHPQGQPEEVRVHDFIDKRKGKAIPYGVYDLGRNAGWVSVGVDHDTAAFAVGTIRRWWRDMGRKAYPRAGSLLITADSGGSNGSRLRLWKWELQKFADDTGLTIRVSHLPPGTSKWNKIEHRLFSFISQNWRGRPLLTHATVVDLIGATRTSTGLRVRCVLDTHSYPPKVKISDDQMSTLHLVRDSFHEDWNYTIKPRKT